VWAGGQSGAGVDVCSLATGVDARFLWFAV
jgi:hypothetical protein